MKTSRAEEIRRRYHYRRLVLTGKAKLPVKTAAKLIGPHCAYHLYSRSSLSNK